MEVNEKYLINEYILNRKSMKEISIDVGVSPQTIMLLIHKFNIPINKQIKAWNSGKTYKDDSRILAKDKHPRHKNTAYYNSDFKRLRKEILPCSCELCDKIATLLHHKDKNKMNNNIDNLQPLCSSCHTILHNKERGITIYKHNCEWCGKEFIIKYNKKCKQKCCSLQCKSKYQYHILKTTLIRNHK